mmetsp:Transcript_17118/g.28665  ORF Transcript_17118/g.28665 Transcript_17118/m.28665 type:complete len:151 (+) Transcript_17118:49-501(+)|eukprot:CAMPEP_0119310350 /NCGR_PEP_ID=MMETSP1333-20130426/18955_1 /TAXON_ID=418940 /ORGANISM="Scyphosphaera apsteinii, Strain RCC1455" /LENGTH=150 /DNA_ID=CAMNT_0007314519 /DNA_START=35 /DNA_END=487 /DNA_ORIENTATION=-
MPVARLLLAAFIASVEGHAVTRRCLTTVCFVKARPAPSMLFDFFNKKPAKPKYNNDDAIAFQDLDSLSPEEERRLKLEIGTNWRPRTSTVAGQGYTFFQGPTPKTSVQEGMPDFFSADNFAGAELPAVAKVLAAVGSLAFVAVAVILITG